MALARAVTPRIGCTSLRVSSSQHPQKCLSRQTKSKKFSTTSTSSAETATSSSSSTSSSISPLSPRFMPKSRPVSLPNRIKPASPSFYTAKPNLVDSILLLEDLTNRTKRALEQNSIPIDLQATATGVNAARRSLRWPKIEELSAKLEIPLRSGQYRNMIGKLSSLARFRYFLQTYFIDGKYGEKNRSLAEEVEKTLENFNQSQKNLQNSIQLPHHASFLSSSCGVDYLGRAYARGRRKESSARVYIVPVQDVHEESKGGDATISNSILINAQPISEYFTRASDREIVLFPLRLLGMAGAFNVFALVKGGGTTGQTGAVAHGLSRALVSWFDDKARKVEDVDGISSPTAQPLREQASNFRKLLSRTGILHRDPRMVERKKTGKAKSRKAYTWVKR